MSGAVHIFALCSWSRRSSCQSRSVLDILISYSLAVFSRDLESWHHLELNSLSTWMPLNLPSSYPVHTSTCVVVHAYTSLSIFQVLWFLLTLRTWPLSFCERFCPWNFSVLLLTCLLVQGRQRSLRLPSKLLDDWPQTSKEVHRANLWGNEGMMVHRTNATSKKAANFTVKSVCKSPFLVRWEPSMQNQPLGFSDINFFTRSSPSGTPSLQIWAELLCHKNAHFQSAPRWRGAWSQQPHKWPSKCTRCKMRPNTSACSKNLGVVLHKQVINPHGIFPRPHNPLVLYWRTCSWLMQQRAFQGDRQSCS